MATSHKSTQTSAELTIIAAIVPANTKTVDLTAFSFRSRLHIRNQARIISPAESNLYYNPTLVVAAATAALIA